MRFVATLFSTTVIFAAATADASVGIVVLAPDAALAEHGQNTSVPVFMEPDSSQCITQDPDGVRNCPTQFASHVGSNFTGATVCLGFAADGSCIDDRPGLATGFFVAVDDDVPVGTTFTVTISGRGTNGAASTGKALVAVTVAAPLLTVPPLARAQDVPPATITIDRGPGESGTIFLSLGGQAGISGTFPAVSSTVRQLQLAIAQGVAPGVYDMNVHAQSALRDPTYPIAVEVPFRLDLAATSVTVARGRLGSTTATIARLPGFSDPVAFAIERLSTGQTFPPLPPSVSAAIDAGGHITIVVPAFSNRGSVDFLVKGTAGGLVRSRTLRVVVP